MAQSPSDNSSEVLKITVSVDGTSVEETVNIARIVVKKSVNRIPRAVISILDGDMPSQEFKISDTEDFIPGKKIEIGAGYGAQAEVIFSGIITQHSIDIRGENESTLIIECKDEAVKMTVGRKNENYIKQTPGGSPIKDKTVISSIIGDYSGLSVKMTETTAELSGLVQYNATDWDFIVSRAEANAMLVMVSDGVINIEPPDLTKAASLSLVYGDDIFSFNASLDSLNQYKKVTSVGWDLTKHSVVEEPATANRDASDRGSKNGDLAKVVGLDNYRLQSQTPMVQQSLKEWAGAEQLKSQLALLRGEVRFQGVASAAVGEMIELTGVGERFSGNVFSSAVEHEIEAGNWITEVEFGYTSHWFSECEDITAPAASGLLPSAQGLQIGLVTKLDQDPDNQYRIQVSVPLLQAKEEGVWARLAHYYASSGFGAFFIPEIGDEVVLGYFNNDPSYPVILGSLYSEKNAPLQELTAENYIKNLTTKTQLKLQFDDEKKIITVETPGGHSLVMDDDAQNIVITDSNKNEIEMNAKGISMTSPGDITLTADGKIALTAKANIEASATGDVKIDGMNITSSAKTSWSGKGSASAELTATGTTTIKGAMVMIN